MTNKPEQPKVDEGIKEVSAKIEAILNEHNMALQPLLTGYPYRLQPSVQLVRTELPVDNTNNDAEQGTDTEKAEGAGVTDGVADAKQS